MRIEFTAEGGLAHLPGLARPFILESGELPAGEAAELGLLIEKALASRRPSAAAPPGAADLRRYIITIGEGARRETLEAVDPIADPDLRSLVERLLAKARAARAASRNPSGRPPK
jgi:hypothetical protein